MTALDVFDRFTLGHRIDLEEVSPLEQLENFLVRFPLAAARGSLRYRRMGIVNSSSA
jgi:hypothetical protein